MKELLTGETGEAPAVLSARAADVIHALGSPPITDSSVGAFDLAGCCHGEPWPCRKSLPYGLCFSPEFPVYAVCTETEEETATAGIADARSARNSTPLQPRAQDSPDRLHIPKHGGGQLAGRLRNDAANEST